MQICMNKTNVVPEDFMKLDQLMYDDVKTVDINKSVLKVGCLFACLLQKKGMLLGPHINVEKIKEFVNTRMRSHTDSEGIAIGNRILDKCTDQVKSKTDECEVAIKILLCAATEINRLRNV
ncbi:pheromone-binding protein Gp-9-like isoform X2 [Linepithema humile]|nr:PREDICTED: pheromone-binding protein Gp-9-like isoform X2 [Linepithema humile]